MKVSIDKESRKIKILNAAKILFGQYGIRKTSLEDISKSLGLVKTSIYHYFDSKAELVNAVIRYESEILINKIEEEIRKHDSPQDKLKAYFKTRMDHLNNLVNLEKITRKAAEEILPLVEKERDFFNEAEKRILFSILIKGIDEKIFKIVDPEFVAVAIIASMKGMESSLLIYLNREMDNKDSDAMLDILFNGILNV